MPRFCRNDKVLVSGWYHSISTTTIQEQDEGLEEEEEVFQYIYALVPAIIQKTNFRGAAYQVKLLHHARECIEPSQNNETVGMNPHQHANSRRVALIELDDDES